MWQLASKEKVTNVKFKKKIPEICIRFVYP